ncbi:MAG: hypothetical protein FRX49_07500 [Trebouxia sp. A1-2]|nr:MAG: hypothetical protein FRX49_07500 [Trebouxia sp. A1-2]
MAWGRAVLMLVQPTEQLGLPASTEPPLQQPGRPGSRRDDQDEDIDDDAMMDTLVLQTTFLALLGTIPKALACAHEACWYAAKAHQGRLKWESLQQLLIELQANNISTLRMQPANPWQLHLPINQAAGGQLHAYHVQNWQKLLLSTDPSRLQDYTSDFWHHNSLHDQVQVTSASTPQQYNNLVPNRPGGRTFPVRS